MCGERVCDDNIDCAYFTCQKVKATLAGAGNILNAAEACYSKGGTAAVGAAIMMPLPPMMRRTK